MLGDFLVFVYRAEADIRRCSDMYYDRVFASPDASARVQTNSNWGDWSAYHAYRCWDLNILRGPNQSEHPGLVPDFVLDDVLGVQPGARPQTCWVGRRDFRPTSVIMHGLKQKEACIEISGWITVIQECEPPQDWVVVTNTRTHTIAYLTPIPIPEGTLFYPLQKTSFQLGSPD
jgi:hypothetical protein